MTITFHPATTIKLTARQLRELRDLFAVLANSETPIALTDVQSIGTSGLDILDAIETSTQGN